MTMKNSQPWFIDAMDRLEAEFFDQFMDDMNEQLFCVMTEMMGNQKRTMHEAAEQINCAMHGRDMIKLMDDEYEDLSYDQFYMENVELVQQLMKRMLREAAERW